AGRGAGGGSRLAAGRGHNRRGGGPAMTHTTYPAELGDLDPCALLDTEVARLDRHFVAVGERDGWGEPTGAAGWSVRDILAHVLHSHRYDRACLDGTISELFAEAASHGVTDVNSFNDWGVREGRKRPTDELLAEWRTVGDSVRSRFRQLGRHSTMPTT